MYRFGLSAGPARARAPAGRDRIPHSPSQSGYSRYIIQVATTLLSGSQGKVGGFNGWKLGEGLGLGPGGPAATTTMSPGRAPIAVTRIKPRAPGHRSSVKDTTIKQTNPPSKST